MNCASILAACAAVACSTTSQLSWSQLSYKTSSKLGANLAAGPHKVLLLYADCGIDEEKAFGASPWRPLGWPAESYAEPPGCPPHDENRLTETMRVALEARGFAVVSAPTAFHDEFPNGLAWHDSGKVLDLRSGRGIVRVEGGHPSNAENTRRNAEASVITTASKHGSI